MTPARIPFAARHMCVVVPTRDRPERMRTLLTSLLDQPEPVGRVIVVASGADIRDVIAEFDTRLSIDYLHTNESGQIRQRNLGLRLLDDRTPLVACLDDDILVERGSVDRILAFWNQAPADTAGVGFNITNGAPEIPTRLKLLMGTSDRTPGRVLRSGITTSISHLTAHARTQWLNGGTTVWRAGILRTHVPTEIDCSWAFAEDLIFSYPIGKRFPLFVCADAPVQHLELKRDRQPSRYYVDQGRTQSIWLYHFVRSQSELSPAGLIRALTIRIAASVWRGLRGRRTEHFWYASGILRGFGVMAGHAMGRYGETDIRVLTQR